MLHVTNQHPPEVSESSHSLVCELDQTFFGMDAYTSNDNSLCWKQGLNYKNATILSNPLFI